jgi:hypothetical protein
LKQKSIIILLALALLAAAQVIPVNRRLARKPLSDTPDQVPPLLSYQGRLLDTFGIPVSDTVREVIFRLYPQFSGGSPFWEETQQVRTQGGLFWVLLGANEPVVSLPEDGNLYLAMCLPPGPELAPRLRITSAAYSYYARKAENSECLQGLTPDSLNARYIYEGKSASVSSGMLQTGSVTSAKVADASLTSADVAPGFRAPYSDTAEFARNAAGGGTVESVAQDTGLICTPNPITTGGTIRFNTAFGDGRYLNQTGDSVMGTLRVQSDLRVYGRTTLGDSCSNTGAHSFCAGHQDTASGYVSTVSGGQHNVASGSCAAVSGGFLNRASGLAANVAGGWANEARHSYAAVGGGLYNVADSSYATVAGGEANVASGMGSSVAGGVGNSAQDGYVTIAGGYCNTASLDYATIGGGNYNRADERFSSIAGGDSNRVAGRYAGVGGGRQNNVNADCGAVAGGEKNGVGGYAGFIGGGTGNSAQGYAAVACGGYYVSAGGLYSTVGGGLMNVADSIGATIAGGENNSAGRNGAVTGGKMNSALGQYSTALGGYYNQANAVFGAVGGYCNKTTPAANNTFVFGENCSTSTPRAVVFYHSGALTKLAVGVQNPTHNIDVAGGAYCNGANWVNASSRELKTDISTLSPAELAALLAELERTQVVRYRYRSETTGEEHIGLLSEDAPDLLATPGRDGINTADAIGFLLAVAKAQQTQIEALKAALTKQQ